MSDRPLPDVTSSTFGRTGAGQVSFLIPSYGRPAALRQCLVRLKLMVDASMEIVVVVREDDYETRDVALELGANVRTVGQPGVIAALRVGFAESSGDLVAVLDDDTVPDLEWLELCLRHLEDPQVGMVGGRDRVYLGSSPEPLAGPGDPVGLLTKWGQLIGNHHCGTGSVRPVDHLKGCNFIIRAQCLRRPFAILHELRGNGAQVANETGICLSVREAGWGLVYDPRAQVAHYPAVRRAGDHRNSVKFDDVLAASFNETLVRLVFVPSRWLPIATAFALLGGTGTAPGIVRMVAMRVRGREVTWWASLRGILSAAGAAPRLRRQVRRESAAAHRLSSVGG